MPIKLHRMVQVYSGLSVPNFLTAELSWLSTFRCCNTAGDFPQLNETFLKQSLSKGAQAATWPKERWKCSRAILNIRAHSNEDVKACMLAHAKCLHSVQIRSV